MSPACTIACPILQEQVLSWAVWAEQQPCPAHGPAALQEVTFASLALESTSASPLQMKLSASLGKHARRPSAAQQLLLLLFCTRVLFPGKEKLGETEKYLAGVGRGSWVCSSWLRPFWIDAALELCGSRGCHCDEQHCSSEEGVGNITYSAQNFLQSFLLLSLLTSSCGCCSPQVGPCCSESAQGQSFAVLYNNNKIKFKPAQT